MRVRAFAGSLAAHAALAVALWAVEEKHPPPALPQAIEVGILTPAGPPAALLDERLVASPAGSPALIANSRPPHRTGPKLPVRAETPTGSSTSSMASTGASARGADGAEGQIPGRSSEPTGGEGGLAVGSARESTASGGAAAGATPESTASGGAAAGATPESTASGGAAVRSARESTASGGAAVGSTPESTATGERDVGSSPDPKTSAGLRMRGLSARDAAEAMVGEFRADGLDVWGDRLARSVGPDANGSAPGTPAGRGTYRYDRPGFVAHVERDGSVRFRGKPSLNARLLPCVRSKKELAACTKRRSFPLVSISFDLNAWLERMAGNDPYQVEKAKYLDATRDERQEMALVARREVLREALLDLPGLLEKIWREQRWPEEARRRALFELWDECAEVGPSEVVAAGRAARATILAFVRRRLPAGSPHAYTPEELAELNRLRRSRAPFDPYRE